MSDNPAKDLIYNNLITNLWNQRPPVPLTNSVGNVHYPDGYCFVNTFLQLLDSIQWLKQKLNDMLDWSNSGKIMVFTMLNKPLSKDNPEWEVHFEFVRLVALNLRLMEKAAEKWQKTTLAPTDELLAFLRNHYLCDEGKKGCAAYLFSAFLCSLKVVESKYLKSSASISARFMMRSTKGCPNSDNQPCAGLLLQSIIDNDFIQLPIGKSVFGGSVHCADWNTESDGTVRCGCVPQSKYTVHFFDPKMPQCVVLVVDRSLTYQDEMSDRQITYEKRYQKIIAGREILIGGVRYKLTAAANSDSKTILQRDLPKHPEIVQTFWHKMREEKLKHYYGTHPPILADGSAGHVWAVVNRGKNYYEVDGNKVTKIPDPSKMDTTDYYFLIYEMVEEEVAKWWPNNEI